MNINRTYVSAQNTYSGNTQEYIVIHNTDNFSKGANAMVHAKAQSQGNLSAMSAHYYVDDGGTVYQAAEHNRGCWHVGKNYGGKMFGTVNNRNSIGIEMCVQSGYSYEAAFQATVALTKQLMQLLNIPADRVVSHYDVCAKNCPSQIRAKNDWNRFKQAISGGQPVAQTPVQKPVNQNKITEKGEDAYMFKVKQIGLGDAGNDVLLAEEILMARGYYKGQLDKVFGGQMHEATKRYQADRKGAAGPVDGIIGPKCWADMVALPQG